jgi:WD40 repeat protein
VRTNVYLKITLVGFCIGLSFERDDFCISTPAMAEQIGGASMTIRKELDLNTTGAAVAVAWSSDGSDLAAASNYGGTLTVWNRTGRLVNQFLRKGGGPALSGGLALIKSASQLLFMPPEMVEDGVAFSIWDVSTGLPIYNVPGPQPDQSYDKNRAQYLVASPDQSIVVIGITGARKDVETDKNIAIYNTTAWLPVQTLKIDRGVFSLSLFNGGMQAVVGSTHGYIAVLDTLSGQLINSFHAYEESQFGTIVVGAIAGSPDGKLLLAGIGQANLNGSFNRSPEAMAWESSLEPVRLFRASDGMKLASFTAAKFPIRSAAWDPKGRYAAFVDNSGGLFVWQPLQGGQSYTEIQLSSPSLALAISPNGERIAVTTSHGVSIYSLNIN